MPVHSISWLRNNGDIVGIRICKASNDCQDFPFAGVVMPDNQAKANAIAEWVQENYLDVRQLLNTLPPNDPDRKEDPAIIDPDNAKRLFWEGPGSPGKTYLVSRSISITIEWTGSAYVPTLDEIN